MCWVSNAGMYAQSNLGTITARLATSAYSSSRECSRRRAAVSRRRHARAVHRRPDRGLRSACSKVQSQRAVAAVSRRTSERSRGRSSQHQRSASATWRTDLLRAFSPSRSHQRGLWQCASMARDRRVLPLKSRRRGLKSSSWRAPLLQRRAPAPRVARERRLLRPPPQGDLGCDPQPRSDRASRSTSSTLENEIEKGRQARSDRQDLVPRRESSRCMLPTAENVVAATPRSFATARRARKLILAAGEDRREGLREDGLEIRDYLDRRRGEDRSRSPSARTRPGPEPVKSLIAERCSARSTSGSRARAASRAYPPASPISTCGPPDSSRPSSSSSRRGPRWARPRSRCRSRRMRRQRLGWLAGAGVPRSRSRLDPARGTAMLLCSEDEGRFVRAPPRPSSSART